MELKSTTFRAIIQKFEVKRLGDTGDKGGKLVLVFNVNDELISNLNQVMRANEEAEITIKRCPPEEYGNTP